ncbi:MAG: hypothetical protein LUI12_02115 [Clostridiales bacterium]|nr:hypothetical protein [Clostridiales bacterium]
MFGLKNGRAKELKQELFEAEQSDWFEGKSKVAMEPPITENVVEAAMNDLWEIINL